MGSKQSHGSLGRTDLHWYDPNDLTLIEDPKHPLYDERVNLPANEGTIKSIMMYGVIEPVIARVNGQDENGKTIVEVIDGRQRTRSTRIANERLVTEQREPHRVPVILKKPLNGDALGMMIVTNEVRSQDGPLVRARKMQRYIDHGHGMDEVLATFGIKSQTTVKSLLALLDLDEGVQKEIERGVVGIGLAKKLALFPREQQAAELRKIMEASGVAATGAVLPADGSYDDPEVRRAALGDPDPRLSAPDEDEEKAPVPLDKHTAAANPPSKREAKKAAKAALKQQMGKRGAKLRQRSVKTSPQLKEAREALKGSRSDVSAVFDAALAWVLGEEDALSGYAAIAKRLEGV